MTCVGAAGTHHHVRDARSLNAKAPSAPGTARNRNIRIGMRVRTVGMLGVAVCMVFISLVDWFSSFLRRR